MFLICLIPRRNKGKVGATDSHNFYCEIGEPDGEFKLCYGAADTTFCVATAHINALIESCFQSAG